MAIQFGIKAKTCQRCPVKKRCLAPNSKGVGGRRVNVIRQAITKAKEVVATDSALVRSVIRWISEKQPSNEQPIFWCDIAATRLRREWHERLARQEVEIKAIGGGGKSRRGNREMLLTRQQREHHRLSWWERLERNEREVGGSTWCVVLYGGGKTLVQGLNELIRRSFMPTT